MHYVYVLKNEQGKHYIGYTSCSPVKRAKEHNDGKCQWTKSRRSWELVYSEHFDIKNEAIKREKQLKRFKGGKALKKLLSNKLVED